MCIDILRMAMRTGVSLHFITHAIIKFALIIRARCCNSQVLQEYNTGRGRRFLLHAHCFFLLRFLRPWGISQLLQKSLKISIAYSKLRSLRLE